MKESDIVYENGNYWVARERDRYTVYQSGATHSISDSSYGKSKDGLTLAIARCDYLEDEAPNQQEQER
jgi:hypothetical protein